MRVDVLLVALADPGKDARTLNLARALTSHGMRVAIAAAESQLNEPSITFFSWPDPGGSALRRWKSFTAWCKQQTIQPRVIGAMDLFALQGAMHVAKRSTAKVIYDMREFYFALGPLEGRGLKQRIIAWHERKLLKRVSAVMVSARLDAALVQERFALKERPFVLLNTPPYKDRVESGEWRVKSGDVIALYQGVVHEGRGLRPFIRALPSMPDVCFVIIGDGPARESISEFARQCEVDDRVHWHGSVPYDELHALTCAADIGICLIEPVSLSYEYALPNKLFEYMMARIPCIVSDLKALHDQIMRTPVGMLVDRALSVSDIVSAMDQVRNPATRSQMIRECEAIRDLAYERQSLAAADLFREYMT